MVEFVEGPHTLRREPKATILKYADGREHPMGGSDLGTLSAFIDAKNEEAASAQNVETQPAPEGAPAGAEGGIPVPGVPDGSDPAAGSNPNADDGLAAVEVESGNPQVEPLGRQDADEADPTRPTFDTGKLKDMEYVRAWEQEHGKPLTAEVNRYWHNSYRLQGEAAKAARASLEAKIQASEGNTTAADDLAWFESHEKFPVIQTMLDPGAEGHEALMARINGNAGPQTYTEDQVVEMLTDAADGDGSIDPARLAAQLSTPMVDETPAPAPTREPAPVPQTPAPEPTPAGQADPAQPWHEWTSEQGIDAAAEEANYTRIGYALVAEGKKFASPSELFEAARAVRAGEVKEAMERDEAAQERAETIAPATTPPRTTSPTAISPDLPRGKTTLSEFIQAKADAAALEY